MVIDYIGIRDNMREAMKLYGGDTSVAPTYDDVEQATSVFREELEVLKNMFTGYDLTPFLNMECDPRERLQNSLQKQRNMYLYQQKNYSRKEIKVFRKFLSKPTF